MQQREPATTYSPITRLPSALHPTPDHVHTSEVVFQPVLLLRVQLAPPAELYRSTSAARSPGTTSADAPATHARARHAQHKRCTREVPGALEALCAHASETRLVVEEIQIQIQNILGGARGGRTNIYNAPEGHRGTQSRDFYEGQPDRA